MRIYELLGRFQYNLIFVEKDFVLHLVSCLIKKFCQKFVISHTILIIKSFYKVFIKVVLLLNNCVLLRDVSSEAEPLDCNLPYTRVRKVAYLREPLDFM